MENFLRKLKQFTSLIRSFDRPRSEAVKLGKLVSGKPVYSLRLKLQNFYYCRLKLNEGQKAVKKFGRFNLRASIL